MLNDNKKEMLNSFIMVMLMLLISLDAQSYLLSECPSPAVPVFPSGYNPLSPPKNRRIIPWL
jgi:hypothetical protein